MLHLALQLERLLEVLGNFTPRTKPTAGDHLPQLLRHASHHHQPAHTQAVTSEHAAQAQGGPIIEENELDHQTELLCQRLDNKLAIIESAESKVSQKCQSEVSRDEDLPRETEAGALSVTVCSNFDVGDASQSATSKPGNDAKNISQDGDISGGSGVIFQKKYKNRQDGTDQRGRVPVPYEYLSGTYLSFPSTFIL